MKMNTGAEKTEKNNIAPPTDALLLDETNQSGEGCFPIVGIGASAGGLEALEQFLGHVTFGCGMAFIIVQHLDPTRPGALPGLLQRVTKMTVTEIKDGQKLKPDNVYVIPPNTDMVFKNRRLHLTEPQAPRGQRLPIDAFFRSMAESLREHAVAVILSGMGSDGTLGLRAIKEHAGLAMVQDPVSAKFDGMPRSAICAGLADIVAPAEELPDKIAAYLQHIPPPSMPVLSWDDAGQSELEKVIGLLRTHTGHDFSQYKKSTLYRRIARRMAIHQLTKLAHYARYLRDNLNELDLLFKELLIGVTSFFRNPAEWTRLAEHGIPDLVSGRPTEKALRAWVVGCSTGEEAYSLAIILSEAQDKVKSQGTYAMQVFATDLDSDSIERARLGVYPPNIAADISPERLGRFFVEKNGAYQLSRHIRETVIFAQQSVIKDPPFTKLDIISCRNLLIYMEPALQKAILELFHYSLKTNGILFLGSAETIGGLTDLFEPFDGNSRLYRKRLSDSMPGRISFPRTVPSASTSPASSNAASEVVQPVVNLQSLADQLLLKAFSPAAVLVSIKGDILYINGRTGKYLEPAAGKANWNIFVMARDGLRQVLADAFPKALRQGGETTVKNLAVGTNGGIQHIDLTIRVIEEPEALHGMVMVIFSDHVKAVDTTARRKSSRRTKGQSDLAELELECQQARDEIQSIREEMQSSLEESSAASEEMQSLNEELQSTNEELTTSREEMQSLNEELQTVNTELLAKVDELSSASNDMRNLLNSTDVATIFLDSSLRVRWYTLPMTKLLRLLPGDVGRPVTDLVSDLVYPELPEDALEVLRTLATSEKQVVTQDGRWFLARILPYRTQENMINGVVITFPDITASKVLQLELTQIVESLPQLMWTCLVDGSCDHLTHQWTNYTGIPENEQLGYGWLQQVHPDDRDRVSAGWRTTIETGESFELDFRIRGKEGAYRWFRSRAQPIRDTLGRIIKWYGINTDINDLRQKEAALQESQEHFTALLASINDAV